MSFALSRWTAYGAFTTGIGVGLTFIAFTELMDVRVARYRQAILALSILSAFLCNVGYMQMVLELHDYVKWQYYVNAYIIVSIFSRMTDFISLYHYVERLLIVTNRIHLRRYIPLVLLLLLPKGIATFVYLDIAVRFGMIEWSKAIGRDWVAYSATSLINAVVKFLTAVIDIYILYELQKKGLNKLGLSKTRILRIVLSVLFAIVNFAVYFPTIVGASTVFSAMYHVLQALDCVVIIDFFNIDLQNVLSGNGRSHHPTNGKSAMVAAGTQSAKLSSTQA